MNLKSYGILPITLWMNMPSHHQDDLIRCLDETPGVDLDVVYDSDMAAHRRDMGWRSSPRPYRHRILSGCKTAAAVRHVLRSRSAIHIFNGIWAVPSFAAALLTHLALPGGAPCFVYSEAPSRTTKRPSLRHTMRNAIGRTVARSGRCGVLAVSHFAADFYGSLGFTANRIYPFAYFRDSLVTHRSTTTGGPRLVFAGTLWEAKGIDLLLEALDPLWSLLPGLSLDLIGGGPSTADVQRYIARRPGARICLRGVMGSGDVSTAVSAYDLLVLPSRGDGWGVVVNEALAAGVPALVSDACGAADVIVEGENGFIVPAGSAEALRGRILAFAAKSSAERARMSERAAATGESLQPQVAAQYLLACVRHALHCGAKPAAPWMTTHEPVLHR